MDFSRDNVESKKTTVCRMFLRTNHCNYGDRCIFAHVSNAGMNVNSSNWQNDAGMRNLNPMNQNPNPTNDSNSPRIVCRHFSRGKCPYNRCKFVHQMSKVPEKNWDMPRETAAINVQMAEERQQVDLSSSHLKTRLCNKWKGPNTCNFGNLCTFAHGQAELRIDVTPPSRPGNWSTTSRTINRNNFPSNAAAKQPALTDQTEPPKPVACPLRLNNKKLVGIYGDWIDEDSLYPNSARQHQ